MPAAGVAGLIKTALALYHKVLPPTLNVDHPNPKLELEKTPFYINTEARPWIHGDADAPRRAGVNAFGFGGINAHSILEEYPALDELPAQDEWDTEVCVLSATSREELVARVDGLRKSLQSVSEAPALKDLAHTLNVALDQAPVRIAFVASSVADLNVKMDRALERLADGECHKIQDVQGIYFFERSLTSEGKVAFLFPGEGSQYVNMLADLCIHFPEVRKSFDFVDQIFKGHERNFVPSDFIFPHPVFSETERKSAEEKLWQMEGAFEAVLTASWALYRLLDHLGVRPQAILGHSTGEYVAMRAAGMLNVAEERDVARFASELNRFYYRHREMEGEVPRAALIAVGADFETVSELIRDHGPDLHVAMDNCPHQTVVVGGEDRVNSVIEIALKRGLICERLPFDRPYHTPLFGAYADKLGDFFHRWLVAAPQIDIYSCTSMSRFPSDVNLARDLAVKHWVLPVEFRKTIEAMYDDGVRIFIEVGPRGNLSAFVDDTLRGRPHLAVPANVMNRSGTTQLNHLLGLLAAHQVSMNLEYLYQHRSPRRLALDRLGSEGDSGRESRTRMKLAVGWIPLRLSEETAGYIRSKGVREVDASRSSKENETPASSFPSVPHQRISPAVKTPSPSSQPLEPRSVPTVRNTGPGDSEAIEVLPTVTGSSGEVMASYLQTMDQFLSVQQDVMENFLRGRSSEERIAASDVLEHPTISHESVDTTSDEPFQPTSAEGSSGDGKYREPVSSATDSPPAPPSEVAKDDSARGSKASIRDRLLQIVAERTGYPVEMLDVELDLEADLGIDSIKRVEIVGSFQQQTGLLGEDDMEALSGKKTLRQVFEFLEARARSSEKMETVGSDDQEPSRGASQEAFSMPFLGTVVSVTPGKELVVQREIRLDEDLFLRDHVLGRGLSEIDPELKGLPVVPFTIGMEMMAEAAVALVPERRLVGMRDVRVSRWMALDGDSMTIQIVAKAESAAEASVKVFECETNGSSARPISSPIFEGKMILDESYPDPPVAGKLELTGERPSKWEPGHLYEGMMFHGPAFRGVASMERWGEDGAEANLEVLPLDHLFRSAAGASLVTDPVLLDQPGQVVGFWMAEHLESGYVVFPFHLEELHLYGVESEVGEQVRCHARIALVGENQVRSDLDIVTSDGRVLARLVGWKDRRFDLPRAFLRFLHDPGDVVLSQPWHLTISSLKPPGGFNAYRLGLNDFPENFFTAHGGIWQRALAHFVLNHRERKVWRELKLPVQRRLEWLLGRVVAKDGVRRYLAERYGLALCPADIEILTDERGRPQIQGQWLKSVSSLPKLSIAHSGGLAVAVVGDGDGARGIGVDVERVGEFSSEALDVAFSSDERALLSSLPNAHPEGWPLRMWCAKEAVAKALGHGLVGGPRSVVIERMDPATGKLWLRTNGELGRRVPDVNEESMIADTALDGDLVVATSLSVVERSEDKTDEDDA
jgi:malonyl CoA-acyl carrier protein transacylase/phosphopantetheinyl transferase/acyl carrier protein